MGALRLSRRELAFIVGVPVAWGILLLFHPQGDADPFYPVIEDNITAWEAVHIGTAVFVALFAGAVYLLLRGVEGTAATVSRIGLLAFAIFYTVWETLLGTGTGVLATEVKALPQAEHAVGAALAESYAQSPLIAAFSAIGSVALGVAMIAAVVALRGAYGLGWPALVLMLLATPLIAVHEPPFGPLGLAMFIGAVLLLVRERAPAPAPNAVPVGQPRPV